MTSTYLQNVREISEEGECTSPPSIAFGIRGRSTSFSMIAVLVKLRSIPSGCMEDTL